MYSLFRRVGQSPVVRVGRIVIVNTRRYRLAGLASEMAYSSMLAFFPLVLMVLTSVGLFSTSSQSTFQSLMDTISRVAPEEVLQLVDGFVRDISFGQSRSLLSLSFLGTLWAASGAVSALMVALDQSHALAPSQVRPFWKRKLISIVLLIMLLALTGLVSLLLVFGYVVLEFVGRQATVLGLDPVRLLVLQLWGWSTWPMALGLMTLACMGLYQFGASQRRLGIPRWPGALTASGLWLLVSGGFRLYVGHLGNYNKAYGTVGAVIVLLLWLWLSALSLLMGEQVNIALFLIRQDQPLLTGSPPPESSPPEGAPHL
ncbi:MAG: YihY/virulence factor BrkB family protein [Cyanobacteriota bacterium]|nr:YihY/virulence factor BrkB family protein [Cyanobacteriota bacterium]